MYLPKANFFAAKFENFTSTFISLFNNYQSFVASFPEMGFAETNTFWNKHCENKVFFSMKNRISEVLMFVLGNFGWNGQI